MRILLLDCEYTDSDDMLIDGIINVVRQKRVQERLLDKGEDLTLAKALEIGHQHEMSLKQMKLLVSKEVETVHAVKSRHRFKPQSFKAKVPAASSAPKTGTSACGRFGTSHTADSRCPVLGTTCTSCGRPNHWAPVCRNKHKKPVQKTQQKYRGKQIGMVQADKEYSDQDEILPIYSARVAEDNDPNDIWQENLQVLKRKVSFQIDTGAKCNVLTLTSLQQLQYAGKIKASRKVMKSYTNHRMKPLGTVTLPVTKKNKTAKYQFEVLDIDLG